MRIFLGLIVAAAVAVLRVDAGTCLDDAGSHNCGSNAVEKSDLSVECDDTAGCSQSDCCGKQIAARWLGTILTRGGTLKQILFFNQIFWGDIFGE